MRRIAAPFASLLLTALLGAGCATTPRQAGPPSAQTALLREAERKAAPRSPGSQLEAARLALAVATASDVAPEIRQRATSLYNRTVADCVALLGPKAPARFRLSTSNATYLVRLTQPADIDRYLVAKDIRRKHLRKDVRRDGFGGALLGIMDDPSVADPNRPPKGHATPLTAVAEFGAPVQGRIPVTIRLLDPRTADTVPLAGKPRPLAGDFSAQLAFYPHPNEIIFGLMAMLRSDRSIKRSALLFYEPYNPGKIPVLFVHGLMSSPHAWLQVANALNANPEFRRRYQVCTYFYPTGAPITGNAMNLRNELAALAERVPLRRDLVIVGHSMGGILTRMQVTNPGRTLWNAVFQANADKLYTRLPADSILKQALLFRANPHVSRVVFIATPHLGSRLATLRIASLASRFIRMPLTLVKTFNNEVADILQSADPTLRTMPTSIRSLSPDSRLLRALGNLPLTVPSHSIIGNRGRDALPLAESSDGVVPYWSSHLPFARSEIIVPTGHDAFNHPKALAELERILTLP